MNKNIYAILFEGGYILIAYLPVLILCVTLARMTMIRRIKKSNDITHSHAGLRDFSPEGIKYVKQISFLSDADNAFTRRVHAGFMEEEL